MKRPGIALLAAMICLAQACGPKSEAPAASAEDAASVVTPEDEAAAEAAAMAMPQEEVGEGEGDSGAVETAAAGTVTGALVSVEAGDNFYVTIRKSDGEELTALCQADPCQGWMDAGALPAALVGKPVSATVATGEQVDGSGNVMGSFPAVTAITVGQ